MTSAPSEASRRAMLRPMRLAAPVTSATFPASGASDTNSLSFAGCQTSYTFRRLFFSFSNKPSVLSVAFLRVLCVKFRKPRHREHKDSQRTTEKSAFSLPAVYPSSLLALRGRRRRPVGCPSYIDIVVSPPFLCSKVGTSAECATLRYS